MAVVELLMPKMGESIIEATIIGWTKQVGDPIEADETVLEVATDKVDSEVPSPVSGVLKQILHEKDAIVAVGAPLALIETDASAVATTPAAPEPMPEPEEKASDPVPTSSIQEVPPAPQPTTKMPPSTTSAAQLVPKRISDAIPSNANGQFYSPLVRNIAKAEGISVDELAQINGTGPDGRVTKIDLINYIDQKKLGLIRYHKAAPVPPAPQVVAPQVSTPQVTQPQPAQQSTPAPKAAQKSTQQSTPAPTPLPHTAPGDELIELTRMRKVISSHMRNSLDTSAHVTIFAEADTTRLVNWRNKIKSDYLKKHGEKITFSPLFTECVTKALRDHPKVNASLSGDHLVVKKDFNIGIATAMKNGNLIVPVIRKANELNLHGLTRQLNDLTSRARENQLTADEIGGGTFTISNLGTFGGLMGTPIINQPELAILALGAIKKRAVIQETPEGDIIAIRHMMYLSLSFDHRVIDGYQGGVFLNSVVNYIENFDTNRNI